MTACQSDNGGQEGCETYRERAAIIEYHGAIERPEAERRAREYCCIGCSEYGEQGGLFTEVKNEKMSGM